MVVEALSYYKGSSYRGPKTQQSSSWIVHQPTLTSSLSTWLERIHPMHPTLVSAGFTGRFETFRFPVQGGWMEGLS